LHPFPARRSSDLEGEIAVFWAAQPHGLVDSRTGNMCWVHVPFSMFLSWGLPEAQTAPLLSAQPLITHAPGLAARIAHMAERWGHEIEGAAPGRPAGGAGPDAADADAPEIALPDIQAPARPVPRAAPRPHPEATPDGRGAAPEAPADGGGSVPAARLRQVGTMAQYVRDHHRYPIAVADIAASVHLTPSHAMTVFRRTAGVTLGDYVTMCRVAEAQRLLLTTSMKVTEIAEEAGFGSLSSFYEHVSAACGMTPREYRRQGR